MKAKNLSAGANLIGGTLLVLVALSGLPGTAAAQGRSLSLGPPHFPPAARPLLEDIPAGGIGHNFELIDHNPLIATGGTLPRGGSGFTLAIVRNCLYASPGSNARGTPILDISNPRRTKVVGEIPPPPSPPSGRRLGMDSVLTIESENLLVVFTENNNPPFDGNSVRLYDTTDCFHPRHVSTIELPDTPHDQGLLWQGGNPHRVLQFVQFTTRGADPTGFPPPPRDIDLRIYDITDKTNPHGPIAEWSMQRVYGLPTREAPDLLRNAGARQRMVLHSVSTSPDKASPEGFPTQLYTSNRESGFFILDSTALARQLAGGPPCDVDPTGPNPCIRKLHPDPNVRLDDSPPFNQRHTHSAHKVPGRPYVILEAEPGPCPWAWVRTVFIDDQHEITIEGVRSKMRGDLFPAVFGAFTLPENLVEKCPENEAKFNRPNSSFNAHWSLVFENLMFISWRSGGVRAIDISNPGTPFEAGFYFTKPVRETATGLVNPDLEPANSPALKDGLLYIMDRQSGVYVLKYTGPRKEEIPQEGLFTQQEVQVPGRLP